MIRRLAALALGTLAGVILLDRWLAGFLRGANGQPAREQVVARVDVAVPIGEAWARITDIERQVDWMADMKSVRVLTPGPLRIGSRAEARIRILGIGVADPVEVTELLPPHRYGIRHDGPFRGTGEITLDTLDGGRATRIEWSESLEPPVLPNLAWLVMRPVLGLVFQADLDRFKAGVERGASGEAPEPTIASASPERSDGSAPRLDPVRPG